MTVDQGSPVSAWDENARAALDQAIELGKGYLAGLPDRPVGNRMGGRELAAALDEPLPEQGCDAREALRDWWARAEGGVVASPGPRFFGFVNGGTTPAALAGDWLASALDQNAGMWLGSPAAVETELVVLHWLKDLFGLPEAWAGGLTTGATMANLVGLAAGRQWVGRRLGFDPAGEGLGGRPPIRVISSTEIHASAVKALGILGLGRATIERVAAPQGSVDPARLRATLARIDAPVFVIANAGEVNTGAFDRLDAVAEICADHGPGTWLHVDGAFGLFAAVSPRHAALLRGMALADSVAADGHKWLNVPYDCGFAFVRDADTLRESFGSTAAYIAPGGDEWDPHTQVPEMSRRFRALAVWCTLKALGREGYRELVERCLANAADFAVRIEARPGLELMRRADFNIVCFRVAPPGLSDERRDELNRRAVTALQADGRVFVSGTVWHGRAAIRAAFDNWMTTSDDVAILDQAVADITAKLLATAGPASPLSA